MQKLNSDRKTVSLLMFNRNEVDGILRNIYLLYDAVDEIVIVDSSDKLEYKKLINKTKSLNRVKIYRVLPTGYSDPMIKYGIDKCHSKYVFKLDADEEPNKNLIKFIIERKFSFPLYDFYILNEKERYIKPWVLFSKDSVYKVTGIIHEGIKFKLKGKLVEPSIHLIDHGTNKEGRVYITKNYLEIESYERPLTNFYIKNFVLNNNSLLAKIGKKLFNGDEDSISRNIHIYWFISFLVLEIKNLKTKGLSSFKWQAMWLKYNLAKLRYFKSLPKEEQNLRIKISREILENGITNYLGFDNDEYVENLTKHFNWDLKGIDVFKFLVNYRYQHKIPFGKNGDFNYN